MLEHISHNITLIASIVGGLTALIVFIKKVKKPVTSFYTKGMKLLEAVPLIEDIQKQFYPNGGSSMRDSINRIESGVQAALERDWVTYELDSRGIFECDSDGKKCRVNKAWCSMTGISQDDAVNGYGWINGIHHDDRDRVRREWESAIRENRTSEMEYRTATGVKVLAVATVLRNKTNGATLGWLGTLTPVD